MAKWTVGDNAYLVPNLPIAPGIAYKQPRCRIVAIRASRVEIELEDGHRLETSIRNLSTHRREPEPVKPPAAPKPRLVLAPGEIEQTLW